MQADRRKIFQYRDRLQEALLQIVRERANDPNTRPIGHLYFSRAIIGPNMRFQEELERNVPSIVLFGRYVSDDD